MPLFEIRCPTCRATEDVFLHRWDLPNPDCPVCLGQRERLVSIFGVPLSGSLHKYMDPRREGSDLDGFWATRRKSSISGNPEDVFLSSMQEVRDFNRAEGLAPPGEVPTNSTISADGKTILSDGMPGNWRGGGYTPNLIPSRLWEMTKSRTSLSGKDPAPKEMGSPCTVEVADAKMMEKFTAEAGS